MRWFRWRRALAMFAAVLAVQLAWHQQADALRLPFPGKVNDVMVSVIKARAVRMGLSATDAKVSATIAGMSSAGADLAVSAGAALAFGTPIGWGTLIIGAVIAAGVAYCMDADCSISFTSNPNSTVSYGVETQTQFGKVTLSPLVPGGSAFWVEGSSWRLSARDDIMLQMTTPKVQDQDCGKGCTVRTAWAGASKTLILADTLKPDGTVHRSWTYSVYQTTWNETFTCNPGLAVYSEPKFVCYANPQGGTSTTDIPSFVEGLPQSDYDKPASPDLIARVANRLWQNAANKPGYSGIPYSSTDPISTSDVQAVRSQLGTSAWPTVGDLTAPIAQGATAGANPMPSVPFPASGSSTDPGTSPSPTPTPTSSPSIDLGTDPHTPAPNVDDVSASSILDPIFNLLPSIGFSPKVTVPQGTCPVFKGDVFMWHLTIDQHCALIEQNRAMISAAMILAWTVLAGMIILRA